MRHMCVYVYVCCPVHTLHTCHALHTWLLPGVYKIYLGTLFTTGAKMHLRTPDMDTRTTLIYARTYVLCACVSTVFVDNE